VTYASGAARGSGTASIPGPRSPAPATHIGPPCWNGPADSCRRDGRPPSRRLVFGKPCRRARRRSCRMRPRAGPVSIVIRADRTADGIARGGWVGLPYGAQRSGRLADRRSMPGGRTLATPSREHEVTSSGEHESRSAKRAEGGYRRGAAARSMGTVTVALGLVGEATIDPLGQGRGADARSSEAAHGNGRAHCAGRGVRGYGDVESRGPTGHMVPCRQSAPATHTHSRHPRLAPRPKAPGLGVCVPAMIRERASSAAPGRRGNGPDVTPGQRAEPDGEAGGAAASCGTPAPYPTPLPSLRFRCVVVRGAQPSPLSPGSGATSRARSTVPAGEQPVELRVEHETPRTRGKPPSPGSRRSERSEHDRRA